jgi:hypothetical protein
LFNIMGLEWRECCQFLISYPCSYPF